ncbi:MAG: O-succinylhomoserine sulfhydrylase [Parahaliea sp.]
MTDSHDRDALAGTRMETLAVRSGIERTVEDEHSEPIFTTSSYVFDSAADAAARFAGERPGNVYSRYTNPSVRSFEQRIATMEGGEAAVATASGMAAILATAMALLKAGDHVICSRDVFGTTTNLFGKYLTRFGVQVSSVPLLDMDAWRDAVRPNTAMLFLETPSNPLNEVADLAQFAELARVSGALLVVDNTFCTPVLQQPLALGADIVIHSGTKFIDGQGRCLAGVVIGSKAAMEEVLTFLRTCGPTLSPFNAWVMFKGLETLGLRMQAHSRTALELARWLQIQDGVEKVHYAGLEDHPGHALAARQQSGFGGVLSFEVRGAREGAWKVIDATRILSLTANLGDTKSTIVHPATTTHGRLSADERAAAGIADSLIRVAVGLEHVEDIKMDLQRGLDALRSWQR